LNHLNAIPEFQTIEIFIQFLSSVTFKPETFSDFVNKPPVMVSRNMATITNADSEPEAKAVPIAAAYYPTWSASTNPPNTIDFSKFDILFFGEIIICVVV
jgi:chitinase